MYFISVLVAYWLTHHSSVAGWLQRDRWLNNALTSLSSVSTGNWLAFALLPVGLSVLCAGVFWRLPYWIGFLLAIAVLLYSVGRGAWREYTARTLEQLQHGNAEAVWLALENEGSIEDAGDDALWLAVRKHAAYCYLTDMFTVFFWFFALGPVGALFTRLLELYNAHPAVEQKKLPSAQRLQTLLEWLPARYMGLCFCLAGNFATGFAVWRHLALDMQVGNQEFLGRCLDAALLIDLIDNRQPVVDAVPATEVPFVLPSDALDATVRRRSPFRTGEVADALQENELVAKTLRYSAALQDLLARTEMIGLVGLAVAVLVVP